MAQKEDRRVKLTKLLLKNSLIDLMETKSISKITIKEICDYADINRATFYAHFSDQYDLMKSIEDEFIENILKDVDHYEKDITDTILLTTDILNYIYDNQKLSRLLLSDRGDIHFQKKIMEIVHDHLIAQFTVAAPKDIQKAQLFSSYVIAGCVGVIQKWFESDLNKSPKEVAEIISYLATTTLGSIEVKQSQ